MSIKHTSLNHGWFYHYRLHTPKAESLCCNDYGPLKCFMEKMLTSCPDHYFQTGPRSSSLRLDVDTRLTKIDGHEVCKLAELGLAHGGYKTAHSNVEVYMLENDANTVAVEVPIWLQEHELETYKALFDCEEPLTGHIDILRIDEENVWIWDYKPAAEKERYAGCQLLFYAIMLSKRTGIPLERFRCGYFDDKTAFVFKPQIDQLKPVLCVKSMVR
jgi:hypothetical protein